jgi:hypothetical protein
MPSSVPLKGRSSLLPSLGRPMGAGNQKYGVKSAVRKSKRSMGRKCLLGGRKWSLGEDDSRASGDFENFLLKSGRCVS